MLSPEHRTTILTWSRALGDTLLLVPALRAIKSAFPRGKLHLVAAPEPGRLLLTAGEVDSATDNGDLRLSPLASGRAPDDPSALRHALGFPDLVFAAVSRAEMAAAVLDGLSIPSVVANPMPPPGRHASESLLAAVSDAGIDATWDGPLAVAPLGFRARSGSAGETGISVGRVQDPTRNTISTRNAASAAGEAHRLVLLHPGSGAAWKCAPARLFSELGLLLLETGCRVAMIAGPADERQVRATAWMGILNRPPTLEELAWLLRSASAYVGNDSGVTHLAALLGIPTVALFGPTDPCSWGPLGPRVTVLRSCSKPAGSHTRICDDPNCLDSLSVEEALEAISSATRAAGPKED